MPIHTGFLSCSNASYMPIRRWEVSLVIVVPLPRFKHGGVLFSAQVGIPLED